jgi:RNA polymerase sigma-70 factor (ECF subfamily)
MSASFDREFEDIFTERWSGLYRYAHRMTGDSDAASDVAQEAFVRLYRRGARPDGVGAWLVSVVNNLLRDQGRKRARRKRLLSVWGADAPVGTRTPDPSRGMERSEEEQLVCGRLDALPLRQRQVLLLRADGMSYREIADALQMPLTSVGQTLARALEAFRQLDREMADAPD